jgi:pimeloyl-ACP methyl ester carboxylesterase
MAPPERLVAAGGGVSLAETLPDARVEIVSAAGHVANLDNSKAFTRLLRQFLAD